MSYSKFKRNLKKEYRDNFSEPKKKFEFKLPFFKIKYAILLLVIILIGCLGIEHLAVKNYNHQVETMYNDLSSKKLDKVQGTFDIKNDKPSFKQSIFEKIGAFFKSVSSTKSADDNIYDAPDAPGNSDSNSSYETNVQVSGIDEADIAKSDGKYIYSLYTNHKLLVVFDLNCRIIDQTQTQASNLFLYENKIIAIGKNILSIYSFEETSLSLVWQRKNLNYLDSRLVDSNLFFIYSTKVPDNFSTGVTYCDNFYGNYNFDTKILRLNLDDLDFKEVDLLVYRSLVVYMSNEHIYICSSTLAFDYYQVSVISIFDYDLRPIGAVRLRGTILNQFSLDEYAGNLRVVATDTYEEACHLNSISIYNLDSLDRVGYLNENIGLDRQIVKSVSFDRDKCYIVTYQNTDPFYELDISDSTHPKIVSSYQAPGYSSYLYSFKIDDEEYVLGLGVLDDRNTPKISIYHNGIQIGKDYIISIQFIDNFNYGMFSNHKALFIYNDGKYLYLGTTTYLFETYTIFKIDVSSDDVVSVYKEVDLNVKSNFKDSRAFLIDGILYITADLEVVKENL